MVFVFFSSPDFTLLLHCYRPTRFYAAEIVLAIEYLHKKGIIHRDIKLENVRLGANGHVVLGGFSLALPDFTGIEHEIVGSPQCMAPEMIAGDGYGRGVDWWGLGVLLHDMLIGKSPFNADTPEQLFHQITHANVKITGAQFSKTTQDFVESLLVRKPQNRLGGANRGGVFGLRFHHFFTCPKNPESSIDWNEVRAGNVPAPFHLSAITRATAATNAYDQAKDLGFAKPPALPENHNTRSPSGGGGLPPRPNTRGSMESRGSSGYGRRGARGDSPLYEDEDDYEREGEEEVTVQSFVPYSYPAPLTAGSLANEMGLAGMDVFGMKSRVSPARAASEIADNLTRPSTSERAIPFQFQLASIQAGKTAELVREEEAAVRYGVAVNRLASIQADKLVEKELQSQHMLSHPYD
jgi:serine/threonine protein kinase